MAYGVTCFGEEFKTIKTTYIFFKAAALKIHFSNK